MLNSFWTCLLLACGSGGHMADQPRYEAMEASTFFADGLSARRPVPGTVARGDLRVLEPPPQITWELLQRGQERFTIYCSPCHGQDGYGTGMIVQRGFPQPPSYHTERLRSASDAHFIEVMTFGMGVMPSYERKVTPAERWAILAYIRALQLSQNATIEAVPLAVREQLLREEPKEESGL